MQNGFVESFNGRLRDEFSNETLFTFSDLGRLALEAWRRDYNTVRPHSGIGWLTPAEQAAQFGSQWAKPLRSVNGSASWPIAMPAPMDKINCQIQVATG
jgi:putative transposase